MARRCFQDIRLFVFCYGLLILTDIMAGTIKMSSLSTIERRFNLSTKITALLASSFQIGTIIMLPFVSYFGSRWHRPWALFLGSVLLVVGNLIASSPQFIGGRYKYEDVSSNATVSSTQVLQCSENVTDVAVEEECAEDEKHVPTNKLYILLFIGMMINGVGGSSVQPLGMSYIDDYANERNSPLYLGFTSSIGFMGPIAGYILSSVVLRWWVDIGWVDTSTVTITPTHPNWVGAWWLGLIICSAGIAVAMIPFLFFPRNMKKQKNKEKEGKSQSISAWDKHRPATATPEKHADDKKGSIFGRESRGFLKTLRRLFSNVVFLLFVAKFYFGSGAIVGIINFFPKYLEVGFGMSASKASFLTGVINIPCLVVGTVLGGAIMKKMNFTPLGTIKYILGCTILTTACTTPMLFVGCSSIDIAGITVPYSDGQQDLPNAASACNMNCNCAEGTYNPVCGTDGISYISPCHAGCTSVNFDKEGRRQSFSDCSCISDGSSGQRNSTSATPERCEFSKCSHLSTFVIGFKSAASFFGGLAATPVYISLIRSVDKEDKAFAIGLNLMIVRVLAWIPGPLIYGTMIDSACRYWGKKPCTDQSYCKVYDNTMYRHRFYGLILACYAMSCVTVFALFVVVKKRQSKGEDDKSQLKTNGEHEVERKNGDAVLKNGDHHNLLTDRDANCKA